MGLPLFTAGYTWTNGEVATATKLNSAANPVVNTGVALSFGSGSVSAPDLYFTTDTDTGFYRVGADNIAATAGGVQAWNATATVFTFGYASAVTVTSTGVQGRIGATIPAAGAFTSVASSTGFTYSGGTNSGYSLTDGTVTGILFASGSSSVAMGTQSNHSVIFLSNNTTGITLSTAQAVRFNAYGAGTLTTDASGNITATSDERLKVIHGAFVRGIESLRGILPIVHSWREGSGAETQGFYAGFSAQNVKENIPEAVGVMNNEEKHLTLNDRPILATVINALKQLDIRLKLIEFK